MATESATFLLLLVLTNLGRATFDAVIQKQYSEIYWKTMINMEIICSIDWKACGDKNGIPNPQDKSYKMGNWLATGCK